MMNVKYHTLNVGGALNALSTSPDTQNPLVAVGGREVIKIVSIDPNYGNLKERMNLRVGKTNRNFGVVDLKWHPMIGSKHLIATAPTNGALVLWDLNKKSSGKLERVFTEHTRTVNKVCWKPNEAEILLSGSQDGTVKAWDVRVINSVSTFECNREVRDIQFSTHYHNYFATVSETGLLQIWDMRKSKQSLRHVQAHNELILSVDWHPMNSNILATGGRDRTVRVWDLTDTSKPTNTVQTIANVSKVLWRPLHIHQITTIAHMLDRNIHVWDLLTSYVPVRSFQNHLDVVTGISWYNNSPDILLSCSKDSHLTIQSISNAYHPRKDLPTVALAWNPQHHLAAVVENIDRKDDSSTSRDPLASTIHPDSPKYVLSHISGAVKIIKSDQHNMIDNTFGFEPQTFKYLAENYNLFGKQDIETKCKHNASVASKIGRHQLSKMWSTLSSLCTSSFLVVKNIPEPVEEQVNDSKASSVDKNSRRPKSISSNQSHSEFTIASGSLSGEDKEADGEYDSDDESDDEDSSLSATTEGPFDLISGLHPNPSIHPPNSLHQSLEIDPLHPTSESNFDNFAFSTAVSSLISKPFSSPVPAAKSSSSTSNLSLPPPPCFTPLLVNDGINFDGDPTLSMMQEPQLNQMFEQTVSEMLEYYCERGDIQTCIAISTVLRDYLEIEKVRLVGWTLEYIDLLRRLKLFVHATEVIKYSPFEVVAAMTQQFTSVKTCCGKCGKPLNGYQPTCEKCKQKTNICMICQLPVKGCYVWCQKCGKGGHTNHMTQWYKKHSHCPSCKTHISKIQVIHS